MMFAALALAVAVAILLALAGLLALQQRRLRTLSAQVQGLQEQVVRTTSGRGAPAAVDVAQQDRAGDSIALITDLPTGRRHAQREQPTSGRVVSVTLAGPMIKVAALAHGLQRALDDEGRIRILVAFRRELKRQRKLRRRAAAARARQPEGWLP